MENAKKLWQIMHDFDVDGGFGDAISESEVVMTFMGTEDEVKALIDKYDKPYPYDKPYNWLWINSYRYEEVNCVCDYSEAEQIMIRKTEENRFYYPEDTRHDRNS